MACTTTHPIIAGFTTLPSPSITDQTEFCNAVFTYYSELGTFVQDANNLATWVKVTTETACTAKQDAQTAKQDAQTAATNAANSAITAQQQVSLAQQQVSLAKQQVSLAQQIVADAEANVIAAGQAQVDLAKQIVADAEANVIAAGQAQVSLVERFADAAAISANDAQNSAISSQTWALESLESAGIAAAAAGLNFGGFYVLDGELYAEYNNLAIATIQLVDGEFIVELI